MFLGHSDWIYIHIHVYVSQNVFGTLWYNIYMYMYCRMFLVHSDTIHTCKCITECFWDTLIQYIHVNVSQNVFGHSDTIHTCKCITECFWDTLIQYIHVNLSQNVFGTLWYNTYMYMYHRMFLRWKYTNCKFQIEK